MIFFPAHWHTLIHLCFWLALLVTPVLVGLTLLNIWLVVRVLYPLQRLATQAVRLQNGDFVAFESRIGGIAEIEHLRCSLSGMVRHIRHSHEQRQGFIETLTTAQEAERSRIARELHDDTVQSFIVVGQSVDLASQWIESTPSRAVDILKMARQQVTETVMNLRNLIADLRPPALEELGLVPALQMWAENLSDIRLNVEIRGTQRRLNEVSELTLFRCAQEGISNAQRHGRATEIFLQIIYQPECVRLIVSDNGTGFDVLAQINANASHGHYGLLGIQERVNRLNGTLDLQSTPEHGTTLHISLPTAEAIQPPNTVRDPICHALIEPHEAYYSLVYEGERFYFCCPVCQGAFQNAPDLYLPEAKKPTSPIKNLTPA